MVEEIPNSPGKKDIQKEEGKSNDRKKEGKKNKGKKERMWFFSRIYFEFIQSLQQIQIIVFIAKVLRTIKNTKV